LLAKIDIACKTFFLITILISHFSYVSNIA